MHRPNYNQQTKKILPLQKQGYLNFHKLTAPILKSHFKKLDPKKLIYCYFKNFSNEQF